MSTDCSDINGNGTSSSAGDAMTAPTTNTTTTSTVANTSKHHDHQHCGLNSKALAQEIVAWYLDHVDRQQPHASNVQAYFRGPVTALTAAILSSPASSCNNKTAPKNGNSNSSSHEDSALLAPEDHPLNAKAKSSWNGNSQSKQQEDWHKFLITHDAASDRETLQPRAVARLDAFLDGVALAVVSEKPAIPDKTSKAAKDSYSRVSSTASSDSYGLVEGIVGFQNFGLSLSGNGSKSTTAKHKQSSTATGSTKISRCPQICETELVTRLELYIRCLHRVLAQRHDCVVAVEPAKALRARVRSLVRAFVDTVNTVQHVSPVLTRLLTALTKELLAVPTLSESLSSVLRGIVSDYVHKTSFASLAFLSSPETAADQRLTPLILKYLLYLQKNWQNCERECSIERMLSTVIDRDLRRTFKTAEFQSIGHLLEVCSAFRHELQNIQLGPSISSEASNYLGNKIVASGSAELEEEKLNQAVIDLQREVITVNGTVLPSVTNRTDLIELLANALNTRSVLERSQRTSTGKKKKYRSTTAKKRTPTGSKETLTTTSESESDGTALGFSSADGGGGGGAHPSGSSIAMEFTTPNSKTTNATTTAAATTTPRRRGKFRLSTVDFLTKRLLLAASRTGTGGDAYFVVRDLFGGDDVEVVPSKQYPFTVRPATIDLLVRLASVTIKCHASFDVYPKSLVGDCEPLIQIHTTTTETILLQEVRATEATGPALPNTTTTADCVMILQERRTENSGKRILSVKPALYEKVEVWNTPS